MEIFAGVALILGSMAQAWRPKRVEEPPQTRRRTSGGAAASTARGGAKEAGKDGAAKGKEKDDGKMVDVDKEKKDDSSEPSRGSGSRARRGGRRTRAAAKAREEDLKVTIKDKGLKQLITTLCKLNLATAQQSRMNWGTVIDAVSGPKDLKIFTNIEAEGEAYTDEVEAAHVALDKIKKGSEEHTAALKEMSRRPAPAKGNFAAFVDALVVEDIGAQNRAVIQALSDALKEEMPDVSVCKLKSIRDNDKAMIIMNLRNLQPPTVRTAILDSCKQLGCDVKSDTPPPSPLEDEIAAWLTALGRG